MATSNGGVADGNEMEQPASRLQRNLSSGDNSCEGTHLKAVSGTAGVTECTVCYAAMRTPKALHCGHTFCGACIDRLANERQVECPLCRQITNIPDGGLARNVLVEQPIEQYSLAKRAKKRFESIVVSGTDLVGTGLIESVVTARQNPPSGRAIRLLL